MKKLLVLAVACFVASPAFAADLKWYGQAGSRYSQQKFDDALGAKDGSGYDVSTETTKKYDMHARLGVTGGKDHVDYGVGVRTATAGVVNTDYTTFNQNQDRGIGLDLAYFRYSNDWGFGDLSVTVGRGENVFAYDKMNQFLFDNDVNWDGLGWKWKMGNFGVNLSQYILGSNGGAGTSATNGASTITRTAASDSNGTVGGGATAHQNFESMIGVQPNFSFRFTDEIETMFAVGYYMWNGTAAPANATSNYSNSLHGHQGATAGSVNGTAEVGAASFFPVVNPRIMQFLVDTTLPMNFGASFEYLRNKKYYYDEFSNSLVNTTNKSIEAKRTAWAATLTYGKIARAHDWKLAYSYGKRGLASGLDYISNDLFLADEKGHTIMGTYALSDTLDLGFKYMSLKEVSNLDRNGNAAGTTAGVPAGFAASGSTAGRSHTNKYWQLTADVAF